MNTHSSKKILNERVRPIVHIDEPVFNFSSRACEKFLFICLYNEVNLERKKEYERCLKENVNNSQLDKICVIYEENGEKMSFPETMFDSPKISVIKVAKRPTYSDIFEIINSIVGNKDIISILANSDIYFDESLELVNNIDMDSVCLALTRYDVLKDNTIQFHDSVCSQDTWIFRGRIKPIESSFNLGIAGCDNRIAYEIEKAGYSIVNPSLDIKTYHLHNSQVRNYNKTQPIPKPYKFLGPIHLTPKMFYFKKEVKEKSILHIGLTLELQVSMCKALSTLGKYYQIFWPKEIKKNGKRGLEEKILNTVREIQPYLIFMQLQSSEPVSLQFLSRIIEIVPEVKIVNWNGDIRHTTPEWMLELAKCKNVYTMFSNMRDVNFMREKGLKADYLQIGFEESIYNNKVEQNKYAPDIVFTGSLYPQFPLYGLRTELFNALKRKYGNRFEAFGNGWIEKGGKPRLSPVLSASLYNSAKICISVNNFDAEKYTSDRLFNMMASNGFCLVHYYKNIETEFENKKHLVYWKTVDELLELIEYYLANPEERKQIAKAGFELVWDRYKFINRIETLKQLIGEA
jgi:hypothetical protein